MWRDVQHLPCSCAALPSTCTQQGMVLGTCVLLGWPAAFFWLSSLPPASVPSCSVDPSCAAAAALWASSSQPSSPAPALWDWMPLVRCVKLLGTGDQMQACLQDFSGHSPLAEEQHYRMYAPHSCHFTAHHPKPCCQPAGRGLAGFEVQRRHKIPCCLSFPRVCRQRTQSSQQALTCSATLRWSCIMARKVTSN